jgi:hypothetical protein
MEYRDDYERARRYRDEDDYRVSDRRATGGRDWDRADWERRDWGRRHWNRPDWERGEREPRDWARGDWERRRSDEPGFLERAVDELRSWFREDARRRERDDRDAERRWGGAARAWGGRPDEEVDRGWARQWGYVDRGEQRERRGGERRSSDAGFARERGYVDEGYASPRDASRYYEPRWGWGDPSAWGAESGASSFERGRGGAGMGPHAGRGPRGYQRSDERIREEICDMLCAHGYVDASDIEVTVANGEVTLTGAVGDRPQKRMAEDAAEQVSGVREVHNQLRVNPGGAGQDREARPGDPRFRVA